MPRRTSLLTTIALVSVMAAAAAAQPLPVDFGPIELGELVTGCFTGCFSNACDVSGTVASIEVAPPFFVRGVRVGPAAAGNAICGNNPGLTTPATPPFTLNAGQRLAFDIDIVATELGDFDEFIDINGFETFELFTTIEAVTGCEPTEESFCLQNERFKVLANWRRPNGTRNLATRVADVDSADSGLFWFFDPDNWEMLTKVINGCNGSDGTYWVFAAATTNVEYTLVVTDTVHNEAKSYHKPQGPPAPAITDTAAFPNCP